MRSKPSIFATLVFAAVMSSAANANVNSEPTAAGRSASLSSVGVVSAGAAVMPAAVFAAGAGSVSSGPHAASFGAAAAEGVTGTGSEEALPEANLALLLLAALAAMVSVVVRRSGGR